MNVWVIDEVFGAPSMAERRREGPRLAFRAAEVTVADLIRFRVEEDFAREETAFLDALGAAEPRRLSPVHANERERLNAVGIAARAAAPNGSAPDDLEEAVEEAQAAFERGAFLLLVNGRQAERLDEAVPLVAENEAIFLRLMPLQGG